ncbi:MAG: PEGA domain-containing protein [Acidobacteria bacterium]|nr:MAG: PEGA domain-containing protein [Acidobacteriota bacterium]
MTRGTLAALGIFTIASVTAAGCASILNGTRQGVGVTSSPSGATVYANGQLMGKTPMVAQLKRKDTHVLRIELAGYKPYEIALTRHVSGAIAGNIIFGGLIGLVIDAADGAMYKLKPESVVAGLDRDASARVTSAGSDDLVIAVVLGADPSWEKVGNLERVE